MPKGQQRTTTSPLFTILSVKKINLVDVTQRLLNHRSFYIRLQIWNFKNIEKFNLFLLSISFFPFSPFLKELIGDKNYFNFPCHNNSNRRMSAVRDQPSKWLFFFQTKKSQMGEGPTWTMIKCCLKSGFHWLRVMTGIRWRQKFQNSSSSYSFEKRCGRMNTFMIFVKDFYKKVVQMTTLHGSGYWCLLKDAYHWKRHRFSLVEICKQQYNNHEMGFEDMSQYQ